MYRPLRYLFVCLAALMSAATLITSAVQAKAPVIEVFDHMLRFKYTTYEDHWAFSPVSKNGVYVVNNKYGGTVRLKKAIFNEAISEAIAKKIKTLGKNEENEIVSQDNTGQVGGAYAAQGISWIRKKRTHVQLWFNRDEVLHEAQCDGKTETFEEFLPLCLEFLDSIKPLD